MKAAVTVYLEGQCKQNPYNITFHKLWMGRRGKCPLIRMFLFHTSSNMNFDLSLFMSAYTVAYSM